MTLQEDRNAIISLHKQKMSASLIIKTLKLPRSTVYYAIKRFEETGNAQDRPRTGRPLTAVTPENINKIRCRIRRNSERSMREMAKSLGINRESVRIIVRIRLGLRSYKLGRGHYLTEKMKQKRLEKARKMKRLVAAGRHRSIVFTDEKIFTVERHHNAQNDRQLLRKSAGTSQVPLNLI